MLGFGAVGVDNETGGGFEKGFKGHAATINGRTYHKTHGQSIFLIIYKNLMNSEKIEDLK